jgi:hypothetical protein
MHFLSRVVRDELESCLACCVLFFVVIIVWACSKWRVDGPLNGGMGVEQAWATPNGYITPASPRHQVLRILRRGHCGETWPVQLLCRDTATPHNHKQDQQSQFYNR